MYGSYHDSCSAAPYGRADHPTEVGHPKEKKPPSGRLLMVLLMVLCHILERVPPLTVAGSTALFPIPRRYL